MKISLQFHPSGQAFATGSEDKSARLFDLRGDQQLAQYKPPNNTSGFTSCGKPQSKYSHLKDSFNIKSNHRFIIERTFHLVRLRRQQRAYLGHHEKPTQR